MRATKIVATIGPACDAPDALAAMIAAGMDVARLNASHTPRADLERRLRAVRAASDAAGRHVAVMLDLGGPKVRVGVIAPGTVLAEGSTFVLVTDEREGDAAGASVTHPEVVADLSAGDRVLLDDGTIELRVTATEPGRAECVVVIGGPLSSRKGLDAPDVRLSLPAVTLRDLEDLAWGLDAGVDLVAQSFVRDAQDVRTLRAAMGDRVVPIVAKVEKHEAVPAIDAIVDEADVVMVARGDLGVETSPAEVPVIQRRIVTACRATGKPAIVATQMFESMVRSPAPTRAEASDVANAVFDGVDAVMLSAETAVGQYPVRAVETMAEVCVAAEGAPASDGLDAEPCARPPAGDDVAAAVSAAAADLARELTLAAIVTATESGATARAVAARRPPVPIVAATPYARVARQLAIVRGVHSRVVPAAASLEDMAQTAIASASAEGPAAPGDLIVLTAGVGLGRPGTTDLIRVLRV